MADIKLAQGEDRIISVPILDDDSNPVDLSAATDIVAIVQVGNNEQAKYALTSKVGYGTLVVNTTQNHVVDVQIKRDQSKNFGIGQLKLVIVANVPDTVLGVKAIERTSIVGSVVAGYGKSEELQTP